MIGGDSVPGAVAVANYSDAINQTGWAFLDLATDARFPSSLQAYGAGFLEGYFSFQRIYEYSLNNGYGGPYPQNVTEFLADQRDWVAGMVTANPTDPYWTQGGVADLRCFIDV